MTDIQQQIAGERRDLAEILGALPSRSWDAPSLCEGWRVREVVAHMTMPFRYSMPRFLFELAKARGNFTRMSDRCARRDAASQTAAELADTLSANENHPWKPPGGGFEGALTHDVIHGLDITVALGLDRRVPEDRLRVVLSGLTTSQGLKHFGTDLSGIELRADDVEWTFGSGAPLTGAAQDLALVLSGRKLPPGRLHGDAQSRFS
ncbi:MAG: hypothetical protein JWQ81_3960 [Amycolatopsis sp.]|jgi:uncharacterized protein (TIGR03083 family)|uniref:maleylpyruvate isomerase family mycothiol-dependent enzyme n=1 Tax=Amycolatopsis sp. TaxID=37632 RepID=UPI00260F0AC2|nr:maleylpyruvate isomerase family mycothiol-dependent enzyme [Amycolatopsis sp.]MCU1683221.1 hypothetical protein [Amycolatopsis sp.]